MGKCLIFCAAGFSRLLAPREAEDLVIAADGGLTHVRQAGLTPDVILGDFDSLGYVPDGANVFPAEKDDTDAMLAVRRGLSMGCRTFYLYGSLDGPRLDHTLANCQTLEFLAEQGARGVLVGLDTLVTVVKDGTLHFPGGKGGTISLFSLTSQCRGVCLEGLYYPLEQATLHCGFPLGVSNRFTGAPVTIAVEEGSLLVVWQREDGLPEELQC